MMPFLPNPAGRAGVERPDGGESLSRYPETGPAILIGALTARAVFFPVRTRVLEKSGARVPAQTGFALANIAAAVLLRTSNPLAALVLLNAGFLLLVKIKSGKTEGGNG